MAQEYLAPKERELIQKMAGNPLELVQGELKSYLEEFVRVLLPTSSSSGWVVGDFKVIGKDLTAQTGVYVYEDDSGEWLYCNGAAASQTTYADLYAYFGANAFGADAGGNFVLPDCRGRPMHFCGTHTSTQRNDNDGAAVADRFPTMSVSGSTDASGTGATGSGGGGSTGAGGDHNHGGATGTPSATQLTNDTGGANRPSDGHTHSISSSGTHTHTLTAHTHTGPSHSHNFSGSAFPMHLHVGSLLVRF